jgi:hypothetical protein
MISEAEQRLGRPVIRPSGAEEVRQELAFSDHEEVETPENLSSYAEDMEEGHTPRTLSVGGWALFHPSRMIMRRSMGQLRGPVRSQPRLNLTGFNMCMRKILPVAVFMLALRRMKGTLQRVKAL